VLLNGCMGWFVGLILRGRLGGGGRLLDWRGQISKTPDC
jgi:hypothetical protein